MLAIIAVFSLTGCKTTNDNNFVNIDDEKIIEGIKNYNFNYTFQKPGAFLNYRHLWKGYNEGFNDFALPVSKENRLYTYEVEIKNDESYYFAYLPKNLIEKFDENINLKVFENDKDLNICDGKYINLFQNSSFFNQIDLSVYISNNLNDFKRTIDDTFLAGIFKRNVMCISLNVSTKTEIKKEISMFKIIQKNLNDIEKSFVFKNEDAKKAEQDSYNLFKAQMTGKFIYSSPSIIETQDYFSYPYLTFEKYNTYLNKSIEIEEVNNKEVIKLERYIDINGKKVDMLENTNLDYPPDEDVFIGLQDQFKKAHLKDIENNYSYFLYEEIKKIIN